MTTTTPNPTAPADIANRRHDGLLTRGLKHHQSGDLTEAEACYRRILSEAPGHAQANHLLGVLAGQRGQTDAALGLLDRARRAEPNDPAIHTHLGNLLKGAGRLDESVACYEEALTVDPSFHTARFNLGNARMLQERFEDAATCYRRVLRDEPDDPEVLNNLGCALRRTGALEESEATLRRALDLRPLCPDALHNLGVTYSDLARYDDALDAINRSLAQAPEDPTGIRLRSLGNVLLALNRVADAETAYRRSLSARADSDESWNNLGMVLQETKRLPAAFQCFKKAAELNPSDPEYPNNQGIVLTRLGRHAEARTHLERALALAPDHFPTCGNLGTCAMEEGRLDEATDWFQRAIRSAILRGRRTLNGTDRARSMDNREARAALLDLKALLDRNSIPFFLCFGTLLGCVRERDFLPGDKDIDVGVFDDVPLDSLRKILGGSKSTASRVLTTAHQNGVTIDVFVHHRGANHVDVGTEHPVDPVCWRFSGFDLGPIDFLETSFLAPHDPARYLSEMYGGDWRIPDPHFDGLIHSPAIRPGSERLSICYACNRLLTALCKSKYETVAVYAAELIRMDPGNPLYRDLLVFADR